MPEVRAWGKLTPDPEGPAVPSRDRARVQRSSGASTSGKAVRRMTFVLPGPVAEFVIRKAEEQHTTYTDVAARIIEQVRQAEEEALLEEGYRWSAQDNAEFASATAGVFWEAIRGDPDWPNAPEAAGEKG